MRITLKHGGWADTGCWIDGHWGQYGPDRLISIAQAEGWQPSPADEPYVQLAAARLDDIGPRGNAFDELLERFDITEENAMDAIDELFEDAETWLNEQCPEGYAFGWYDGEFFLLSTDEWEEIP